MGSDYGGNPLARSCRRSVVDSALYILFENSRRVSRSEASEKPVSDLHSL